MIMKQICVFCEGKTEYNYIQTLNRLLEECDIFDLRFTAKDLGGVDRNNYVARIKRYKANDLKAFKDFYVWIDYDIFKRCKKKEADVKSKVKDVVFNGNTVIPLLNHMNGEDFIILHRKKSEITKWEKICKTNKHFEKPMHSNKYLPLFKTIIKGYKKGDTPELNKAMIEKCIKNIDDSTIPFKSDVKKILEIVLKQI
jgi:hypothetical protein